MTADVTRIVFCPACGARYGVDPALLDGAGLRVLCGTCGACFDAERVRSAGESQPAEVAPGASEPVVDVLASVHGPRVVIGHEVPSAVRTLVRVLREAGYAPVPVRSGEQVLQACDPAMPATPEAVVLDVGIPGVMAFEVIDQLRAHPKTKGLPVVLLASVFERTRYKRRPNQLYGADAYLELHHVPDRLAPILDALREQRPLPTERLQAPVERAQAAPLRSSPPTLDDDGLRTLVRRLLSDVALYHGDEVAAGVAAGDPLRDVRDAVRDAEQLFLEAAGPRDRKPLFDEELADFVARLNEARRVRGMADG